MAACPTRRARQVGVVRNPVDPDPPQAHPLSRDAGRAGAAEWVEDDLAWAGIIITTTATVSAGGDGGVG